MKVSLSILLVVGLWAISDAKSVNVLTTPALRSLSGANYKFSVDLYKLLVEPGKNLVTSGFSVSTVLSMVLSGARGYTHTELANVLGYSNLTRSELHLSYQNFLKALKGDGNSYDLAVANSLWLERHAVLANAGYEQLIKAAYDAELKMLNLPTGKVDINQWVSEKTQGMIPQLLESDLPSDTLLVLLNAIFFKGKWAKPFNNQTFEGGFLDNDIYIADAASATTKMMTVRGRFNYTDSKELNAYLVDLPYEGGDVSMTIVLPHWRLRDLEANLTSDKLQTAVKQMYERNVEVVMPVFEIESTLNLNNPLGEMGVNQIFSRFADLGDIAENAKVSKVYQKAKIEVGVEGTKAAAVTGIEITVTSIIRYQEFRATKPFLFLIRHNPTNTILFSGRYTVCEPFWK